MCGCGFEFYLPLLKSVVVKKTKYPPIQICKACQIVGPFLNYVKQIYSPFNIDGILICFTDLSYDTNQIDYNFLSKTPSLFSFLKITVDVHTQLQITKKCVGKFQLHKPCVK